MHDENRAWEFVIRVPEVEIDYRRAALVVIDLQYLTASREYGMFRKLREAGLAAEAEYAIDRIERLVVPNVRRLADAFRACGGTVVFCRCATLRGDGSDQTRRHRAQGLDVDVGSREAAILDELPRAASDIVLTKTGSGCFTSTNLDHLLGNIGVNAVVLAGMWTNSCVETTARHAGDLDYDVVIVEDACVAMTPESHQWTLRYLGGNFAQIREVDEILSRLRAAPSLAEA